MPLFPKLRLYGLEQIQSLQATGPEYSTMQVNSTAFDYMNQEHRRRMMRTKHWASKKEWAKRRTTEELRALLNRHPVAATRYIEEKMLDIEYFRVQDALVGVNHPKLKAAAYELYVRQHGPYTEEPRILAGKPQGTSIYEW